MQRFDDRYFSQPRFGRRPRNDEIRIPLRSNGRTREQARDNTPPRRNGHQADAGHMKADVSASEPALTAIHEETLAQSEAAAAEWKEKYTRLYAERENDRKRAERNHANRFDREKERILQDMLPLADNLERALAHASEHEVELERGVNLTLKAFTETLAKHGVAPMEVKGRQFDPTLHEAIGTVPHPTFHPGTVVDVVETGYSIEGRLLRPARVLVAAG